MFAFLPPAKVARTQRSPLSSMEAPGNSTQLAAPIVAAANSFVPMGIGRVRPHSVAEAEILVGDLTIRPSVFLSGMGTHSCWIMDENTRLLRLWNMNKPFWLRSAPRMAPIPTFTEDEGIPLFVSEIGPEEESLAFCTDYGAVSSLDHSVEFQFHSDEGPLTVSSFACCRKGQSMLTAVGTVSGLVLIAIKAEGERIVVGFDRVECSVAVRTTPVSFSFGCWWRSWLSGKSSSKDSSRNRTNSSCGSDGYGVVDAVGHEFTLLRFHLTQATELWAINAASEVFLLDFGSSRCRWHKENADVRVKWATNISTVLQRKGRVVAFDETASALCCLVYLLPSDGHGPDLEVVTMDVFSGAVRQTLSMQSIGSLVRSVAESPSHHTRIYLDEAEQMVTVLSGHYCVRLNNRVGVRHPCSSEDVHVLQGVERPLGSSLLPDGRIVTLDINGPLESVVDADEAMIEAAAASASVQDHQEDYYSDAWRKSHFTGKREGLFNMVRHVDGILHALRIDAKMSLDSAVLEASEGISSHQALHEGNWARADLDVEDDNMVMYVTNNLVRRQQEHRRFLLTVLLNNEIGPCLQAQTIARILSTQEALLAMVAIRRLQNDSSYPLSVTTATNCSSDVEFDLVTPLYRHAISGVWQSDADSSVEEYFRLARSTAEKERCQQLLREAIVRVANTIRNENDSKHSLNARATAAEIVFGEPSRLSTLLQALGEHLQETQRSVLVDQRTKFDDAMAMANIFVLVTRAIRESREDMAPLYKVPQAVCMMLWTSSELEDYGIQLQIASACITLSSTLAEVTASSNNMVASLNHATKNTLPSLWKVSATDQLRLLDLIVLIIHFSFQTHSQGGPSFYADAIRRTLFREPFLREPLGYPFGAPRPSADATIGAAVLRFCEELALEFTVGEILVSICLAKPVEDPQQEHESYKLLGDYCQRNVHMFDIALHTLLAQRREWELQLLPELVPDYAAGTLARDVFLVRDAPQLAWLVKPTAFEALLAEGVQSPSYLAYGDDLITHRSRSLSMAKLAWVAAGAPTSSTYYAMRLDEEMVTAQKMCLLPETKNMELGPAELVQRLLKQSSLDAWVYATKVACLLEEELREDILTQILRRAKLQDGDALIHIIKDGASELDVARALEATSIGRILITAAAEQCTSVVACIWANVLDNTEQRLLSSWMQMRAAGLVS
ncbi:Nucleoporin [Trypanosoma cruzi]|uniref:Nucleoporin n=1 Tax=Trypanosoma cruzi TaxID=5693 RepID=A0A2V2WKC3_TRYCR|nr:Nucleoporin [Trypanosoma cruzi]